MFLIMKKLIFVSLVPLLAIFVFIAAQKPETGMIVQEDIDLGWPEEVMVLLENACFDCHTADASNLKAKSRLNFSKWDDYKLSKKIGKLGDISEEVKQKSMPPAKYVKDYPDRELTDADIGVITNWANAEAEKLMQE
jgi:hypothetical protein